MTIAITLSTDISSAPKEFRIFAAGEIETTKGTFMFDGESAAAVMASFEKHGQDRVPIDFNHQMVKPGTRPESTIAAGWFVPKLRSGELWATDVEWTERASKMLENREFRFPSPAFDHDNGAILELVNVAITNLPATRNALPLVANMIQDRNNNPPRDGGNKDRGTQMNKLFVALGAENEAEAVMFAKEFATWSKEVLKVTGTDGLDAALEAVKACSGLPEKVMELTREIDERKAADAESERSALIAKLSEDGKLAPTLKEWAATLSIESLTKFGERAPELAKCAVDGSTESTVILSDADEKTIVQMGLDREAFIKERKRETAQKEG